MQCGRLRSALPRSASHCVALRHPSMTRETDIEISAEAESLDGAASLVAMLGLIKRRDCRYTVPRCTLGALYRHRQACRQASPGIASRKTRRCPRIAFIMAVSARALPGLGVGCAVAAQWLYPRRIIAKISPLAGWRLFRCSDFPPAEPFRGTAAVPCSAVRMIAARRGRGGTTMRCG